MLMASAGLILIKAETKWLGRKKTFEHQNSQSAFESSEKSKEQLQVSDEQQGNRRLRRYEAKMARKKLKK